MEVEASVHTKLYIASDTLQQMIPVLVVVLRKDIMRDKDDVLKVNSLFGCHELKARP